MKHNIKKWSSFSAGCDNPGCTCSLEGMMVGEMPQKSLEEILDGDCPNIPSKKNLSHAQRVNHLIKYANKEIKAWQKLIKFWKDK